MRRIVVLAMLLTMLAVTTAMLRAEEAVPVLPDYTAAPFTYHKDFPQIVKRHPEWGTLTFKMYVSTPKPIPGSQAVMIGSDANGDLKYAQLQTILLDGRRTAHAFLFKDGVWVFEKTFHQKTRPPKRGGSAA